jgi:hypothetical protein
MPVSLFSGRASPAAAKASRASSTLCSGTQKAGQPGSIAWPVKPSVVCEANAARQARLRQLIISDASPLFLLMGQKNAPQERLALFCTAQYKVDQVTSRRFLY